MKHGRSNNGRRGRDRGERGGGAAGASAARGVPSNFSAVVAPTVRVGVRGSGLWIRYWVEILIRVAVKVKVKVKVGSLE